MTTWTPLVALILFLVYFLVLLYKIVVALYFNWRSRRDSKKVKKVKFKKGRKPL